MKAQLLVAISLALVMMLIAAACDGNGTPDDGGLNGNGAIDGTGETPTAGTPMGTPMPGTPTPGTPTPAGTPGPGQVVELEIAAQNIQFDGDMLTAPAGAQVRLTFNNMEALPHNVSVYESSQMQEAIFTGEIFSGPGTRVYEFTAPSQPGEYFFVCDVHPDTMTGTFVVQ